MFIFNQIVNRALANQEKGVFKSTAKLLIQSKWADDWSKETSGMDRMTDYPLVSFAASAHNQFPYQTYDPLGNPSELERGSFNAAPQHPIVKVSTSQEILWAIENAKPGQIITISPGAYDMKAHAIYTKSAGLSNAPIYLRAAIFGTVILYMDTHEGFHVSNPFWVFENLIIHGDCAQDSYCEHAFHVVGNGHSFTLRNSELVNFNAPVKVNLHPAHGKNYFPDYGLLEYNSFYNQTRRTTSNPVTLLNINSADDWVVRGNFIADFSKNGGDGVSYGAFMKGNSRNGLFERNLIVCEHRIPADRGIRIGISFGGGGTAKKYCKEKNCAVEHHNGTMRNNIIMNCSRDVGIYLNRANNTQIYHNLLYNNLGIDVRFETSSAQIIQNIISGRIKNRESGRHVSSKNLVARDCIGTTLSTCDLSKLYLAPQKTDFRLTKTKHTLAKTLENSEALKKDFCGQPIAGKVNLGPLQYANDLKCLSNVAH
ncbi:MAG: hypothetical protein AB8B81_20710 [Halioglobus sp.]